MKKKMFTATSVLIVLLMIMLMIKLTNDRYYNEVSFDVLSYEASPQFVKDEIQGNISSNSSVTIKGSDGLYIVVIPPEDKSVEVFFVGEDEDTGLGIAYKYTYTDKIDEDIFSNIKIIKINHYDGVVNGIFVSNASSD